MDSAALVDPDTLAGWTEAWGHWLASLPHEAQVQAATVTIESFPDTGQHLIAETARLSRPGAPDLAGAFLDEVAHHLARAGPHRPGVGGRGVHHRTAPGTARPHRRRCVT